MTITTPPAWADALLRTLLPVRDRDTVSGDLLEEYRSSVLPSRGRAAADRWYLVQVSRTVWRATWIWGMAFAAAGVGRGALDWLSPTTDFALRSSISTGVGVGLLLLAGMHAGWRSGSFESGAVAGVITTAIAAVLCAGGTAVILGLWHDSATWAAVEGSGGLEEALVLPVLLIVPGLVVGATGGVIGGFARRLAG